VTPPPESSSEASENTWDWDHWGERPLLENEEEPENEEEAESENSEPWSGPAGVIEDDDEEMESLEDEDRPTVSMPLMIRRLRGEGDKLPEVFEERGRARRAQ